ncbi:MAG: hypothetical protein ACFFFG_02020 [Candidatus Thorarchaeota archaeon]
MSTSQILNKRKKLFAALVFIVFLFSIAPKVANGDTTVTVKKLQIKITTVSHSGGTFGSYAFDIQMKVFWKRVYNSYWGYWASDGTYEDNQLGATYNTGFSSSPSGTDTWNVYSDMCYSKQNLKVEFRVRGWGWWLGAYIYETSHLMGTRYYYNYDGAEEIPYSYGSFSVTVHFQVLT